MATASDATILIVDDSSDNLSVLHGVLSPEFRVQAAMNGATALRIAQTQPKPDLVLLDVMMPGMESIALASLSASSGLITVDCQICLSSFRPFANHCV